MYFTVEGLNINVELGELIGFHLITNADTAGLNLLSEIEIKRKRDNTEMLIPFIKVDFSFLEELYFESPGINPFRFY